MTSTTTTARPRRLVRSGHAGRFVRSGHAGRFVRSGHAGRHPRMAATLLVAAALGGSLASCSRGRPANPPGPKPTVTTAPGPQPTTTRPAPRPPTTAPPVAVAPPVPAEAWRTEMLAAVNTERAKAGLNPMVSCATLNRAAQGYAEQLSARGVLSHYGPDGSDPAARERAAGYLAAPGQRYMYGAENIAQGYPTVAAVMAGWMGSQGHRDNILASATTHLGMGRQGTWWVQNFGTGGTC
jgi:uncharacterized protein YkwD